MQFLMESGCNIRYNGEEVLQVGVNEHGRVYAGL